MVADRESELLAERLIADTIIKHDIEPGQLTVHADRGPSMRSRTVAQLLADLGVDKTHNRPYTSTDNPYSEAQFQDAQVPTRLPEPVRRRSPTPTTWCQRLLRLVQQPPPPLRHRDADTRRRALRPRHERLARRHDVMLDAARTTPRPIHPTTHGVGRCPTPSTSTHPSKNPRLTPH